MVQTEPLTGQRLGEYQIERLLGQSQLGAAYLAHQARLGQRVMVTTFHIPEGMSSMQEQYQLQQRIARESDALTRLTHPHILPVYGCGLHSGYVYLITAFAKEVSLNQLLKQNQRFAPQQVLPLLKQLASALDYARGEGVFHGMLSLSNVTVSNELHLRIAGFGLRSVLEMYENTQHTRPLDHLASLSGTFLGDAGYVSPERVLGLKVDARADVYALGVMLFTLLSGAQPFHGEQPLDIAIQRLQQSVPSLHTSCSDVSEALDIVLGKMLERDPSRRTQYAGEAAVSFERALKTLNVARIPGSAGFGSAEWTKNAQITIPPTVNWFDEAIAPSQPVQAQMLEGNAGSLDIATSGGPLPVEDVRAMQQPTSLGGTDPFLWWSSASTGFQAPSRTPGTFSSHPGQRPTSSRNRTRPQRVQQDRRKLIKLIAVGGAAAGVVAVGGVSLARLAQSQKQAVIQSTGAPQFASTTAPSGSTATVSGGTPTAIAPTPQTTATPAPAHSPTPQPTAGKSPQPSPTTPPKPTPTPGHTGTVIGHTSQATNSAVAFTNPADGQASLLIRMANGNFVACEKACTHAGVPVNYSSGTQKLVCPAHNATFDPANGFAPTSPAPSALPRVSIRVNGDGTITTG
jgi:serine/threonine protein kinase/nitrite reductase/ring-hydroxylating ferredoxin subunit